MRNGNARQVLSVFTTVTVEHDVFQKEIRRACSWKTNKKPTRQGEELIANLIHIKNLTSTSSKVGGDQLSQSRTPFQTTATSQSRPISISGLPNVATVRHQDLGPSESIWHTQLQVVASIPRLLRLHLRAVGAMAGFGGVLAGTVIGRRVPSLRLKCPTCSP